MADEPAMLDLFEALALSAGRAVMAVYACDFSVEKKSDASPVTAADRDSERIILEGLRGAFPDIPVVAEEEACEGAAPCTVGDAFFLVDPLDGTKEFVNKRGDFTVNIALVRSGVPVIGVVYAPARGVMYTGRPGHAELIEVGTDFSVGARRNICVAVENGVPRIVASRSHRTAETDAFIGRHEGSTIVSVGSSLKFCLVACGEADLYPRFGRTMQWDTAAGDAVLRAAGGHTLTVDGAPLRYGPRDTPGEDPFYNPHFVAGNGPRR